MTKQHSLSVLPGEIAILLILLLIPASYIAQTVFSFNVDNLESYTRLGNWVYDVDGPTFPTHDGNWFTYQPGGTMHFYADKNVGPGTTAGHVTNITCAAENTDVAANPGQVSLVFTQPFQLASFQRVNTVNASLPWANPGQSGDVRIYSNATGYLALDGVPKLYITNLTFVITTPYPNQAQIRALSPAFATWTGNIGSGAPQTGFGYGDVDTVASDPAWAALFAASDYKIDMPMISITSEMSVTKSWFDFVLNFNLGDLNQGVGTGQPIVLPGLPASLPFPQQNAQVDVNAGANSYAGTTNHYFYVHEVPVTPTGALPGGLNSQAKKYWTIGTTLDTFTANLSFSLVAADFAGAKSSADWKVLHRPSGGAWSLWPDITVLDAFTIRANSVTQSNVNDEFTVASTVNETLPVELTSFAATITADDLIAISWSTASETAMNGYRVYYRPEGTATDMICLTPVAIPANNSSSGSNYRFVAEEITTNGSYNFWLEALSMDGSSEFYGPVSVTLNANITPPLPLRNVLGDATPNPFISGGNTRIDVELKAGERGRVIIYNIAGQLVRSFSVSQGSNAVLWDGQDDRGNLCGSGIYFYKLTSPSLNQTKRLVIVK